MKVFISYRRKSWAFTQLLAQSLAKKVNATIFVDFTSIDETNFESSILRHLSESDIVLVVVTEQTFAPERIIQSGDWVRREINLALKMKKNIVLLLVDDQSLPIPSDLPEDIRDVTHMQGFPFYAQYFEDGVKILVEFINKVAAFPIFPTDIFLRNDREYDTWLEKQANGMQSKALQALNLDPSQIISAPLITHSVILPTTLEAKRYLDGTVRIKKGNDGYLRYSIHVYQYIFLSEHFISINNVDINAFSLPPVSVSTEEYFYRDIVGISTNSIQRSFEFEGEKYQYSVNSFSLKVSSGVLAVSTNIPINKASTDQMQKALVHRISDVNIDQAVAAIRMLIRANKIS